MSYSALHLGEVKTDGEGGVWTVMGTIYNVEGPSTLRIRDGNRTRLVTVNEWEGRPVSRSKELERIERALRGSDKRELEWAKRYAETRFDMASMKEHQKFWRSILKQIYVRISQIED